MKISTTDMSDHCDIQLRQHCSAFHAWVWHRSHLAPIRPRSCCSLRQVAEPLEKGLAEDIESGAVRLQGGRKKELQVWGVGTELQMLECRGMRGGAGEGGRQNA